jgi:hypothetical protein
MPFRWIGLVLLFFMGLLDGTAAYADRDIVYAARYYTPPGSHRTSHFHLYRINPDGTGRTQLTFGNGDDWEPRWTLDGQYITFSEYETLLHSATLCKIDANGRRRRVLKRMASDDNSWPPVPMVTQYRLDDDVATSYELPDKHILVSLKTGQRLTLKVPLHEDSSDDLLPMPGNHNTVFKTDYLYYRLNPKTGALHRLIDGQFLVWSPDGSKFCTVPGPNTTPYERRREPRTIRKDASSEERSNTEYVKVWFAPLYVRATAGGPMKQLTPRLSWVTGADWRKPPKAKPSRNR